MLGSVCLLGLFDFLTFFLIGKEEEGRFKEDFIK